jgi:predicted AAA+ superfamily ATPase
LALGQTKTNWVVLDEIQKIPVLLDEVHRLIEKHKIHFALCGSSARKLKRLGTNLLAGRALTLSMEPFSYGELGNRYHWDRVIQWGLLPSVYFDEKYASQILNAYVNTYIKEEIREEGIVRNVQPFLRFLSIAGQYNAQIVNGKNISREAEVPRANVDVYFSILVDTLLGHFLPAYQPTQSKKDVCHPKFYWFDAGVARAAAGLLFDPVDKLWQGSSFETALFHELRVYNELSQKHRRVCFHRTHTGREIDFVIETVKGQKFGTKPHVILIECKLSNKWDRSWEYAMREFCKTQNVTVDRMIGVYRGSKSYHFGGVDVWPAEDFLKHLFRGEVF